MVFYIRECILVKLFDLFRKVAVERNIIVPGTVMSKIGADHHQVTWTNLTSQNRTGVANL